jgi:hypothetical protein
LHFANHDGMFLGKFFPNAINVMDEIDEGRWPVGWPKWHDCVGSFDGVNSLKCQLLLTSKHNGKLMITHSCIKHPAPFPLP